MIDKKPFRVTNEQARAVIACSDGGMECPSTCPNYGVDDCPIGNVADYMLAADLIDSRELNDKQEALIKKQSIMLQAVEKDLNWMLNEGKLLAPHALKYFYDGIKELEKTKDYA